MVRLILDISAARSENCFTLATRMWIHYLTDAWVGNSSCIDGLSAIVSPQHQFVPQPTRPMPAVNIP